MRAEVARRRGCRSCPCRARASASTRRAERVALEQLAHEDLLALAGSTTSMPTTGLPGIGARMRTASARSAIARSSARLTMRFTLTPGAGSNSKVVMTGPGRTATTLPVDAEVGELRLEDARAREQRRLVDALPACVPGASRKRERRQLVGVAREAAPPARLGALLLRRRGRLALAGSAARSAAPRRFARVGALRARSRSASAATQPARLHAGARATAPPSRRDAAPRRRARKPSTRTALASETRVTNDDRQHDEHATQRERRPSAPNASAARAPRKPPSQPPAPYRPSRPRPEPSASDRREHEDQAGRRRPRAAERALGDARETEQQPAATSSRTRRNEVRRQPERLHDRVGEAVPDRPPQVLELSMPARYAREARRARTAAAGQVDDAPPSLVEQPRRRRAAVPPASSLATEPRLAARAMTLTSPGRRGGSRAGGPASC